MDNWMKRLAKHYEMTRQRHPQERLLILFDIDGTILDMRHMVLNILQSFDRRHGTNLFRQLSLGDVNVHEDEIELLIDRMGVSGYQKEIVMSWVDDARWSPNVLLESRRPFAGVMEVMRWFQVQPDTYVGLNTARPESMRADTLRSLNRLGQEYKVSFTSELLHMSPYPWGEQIERVKTEGILDLQQAGFRIFAFVDNEPTNLAAVEKMPEAQDVLLLHADTIFASKRQSLPHRAASGSAYDLLQVARESALPSHVQLVWQGLNDRANLRQFLGSNVQWGEVDVRLDPVGGDLVLRHDSYEQTPAQAGELPLLLEEALEAVRFHRKSLKLDLKEIGPTLDRAVELLATRGFDASRLWFNGDIEVLKEAGFRRLARIFPSAIVQCPIDFAIPLVLESPDQARSLFDTLREQGINRFSMDWRTAGVRPLLGRLDEWGYELNIYNVPDLESFLRAVLLLPKSITSDFNFPQWNYFGRGAGAGGRHHEYAIATS
jgi:hypothetical protein